MFCEAGSKPRRKQDEVKTENFLFTYTNEAKNPKKYKCSQ